MLTITVSFDDFIFHNFPNFHMSSPGEIFMLMFKLFQPFQFSNSVEKVLLKT
jgi:hypothetical protein